MIFVADIDVRNYNIDEKQSHCHHQHSNYHQTNNDNNIESNTASYEQAECFFLFMFIATSVMLNINVMRIRR